MELSNVSKKKKKEKERTIEYDKNMVTRDISTVQCDNGTVKCKKKIMVPPNVTKVRSDVMLVLLNVTMELSNVGKKKLYTT